MTEPVRYSEALTIRCQPEIAQLLQQASLRKGSKPAEYLRQALLTALRLDGFEPTGSLTQYALVSAGELVLSRDGNPIVTLRPMPEDRGQWLPVENEDTEPFDPAQHWRLNPLPLRVDGERVVRTYPVVLKSQEHA
ncbi:hypothetical protein [Bradyrhizobium erythrophlei]|uniref:Uncharacterized protein n=1 Tax=Bradyrhizobium erythrophlei TaxID=1437360 RepID=A0A1H4NH65_9BRAD|nr:hypothetical protein [Bradyrhizobium erythrophlei]SEB94561.1 hypothetical protein SAMN05444164_0629 [Bradyrhizobium erythrophlei]